MADSEKRARRIREVMKNLEDMQRVRVARVMREAAECAQEQIELLRFADQNDTFHSQFVDLISKRISALETRAQKLEQERRRRQEDYCTTAMQGKAAEALLERSAAEAQAEDERKNVLETIEAGLAQALGKHPSAN